MDLCEDEDEEELQMYSVSPETARRQRLEAAMAGGDVISVDKDDKDEDKPGSVAPGRVAATRAATLDATRVADAAALETTRVAANLAAAAAFEAARVVNVNPVRAVSIALRYEDAEAARAEAPPQPLRWAQPRLKGSKLPETLAVALKQLSLEAGGARVAALARERAALEAGARRAKPEPAAQRCVKPEAKSPFAAFAFDVKPEAKPSQTTTGPPQPPQPVPPVPPRGYPAPPSGGEPKELWQLPCEVIRARARAAHTRSLSLSLFGAFTFFFFACCAQVRRSACPCTASTSRSRRRRVPRQRDLKKKADVRSFCLERVF